MAFSAPVLAETCTAIDSRQGWQEVDLPGPEVYELWYDGTWTVDARSFEQIDPSLGHQGADARALAPFDRYKYNPDLEFGRMLLRVDDGFAFTSADLYFMHDPFSLMPVLLLEGDERLYARINDSDQSLADNQGTALVCVE